ncbi:beta propeller domain protein [Peptostreptococcaceae bacterium AS15]|nr:beta propeller domain protein [Peptostreptococcaceae bacterium AS15]
MKKRLWLLLVIPMLLFGVMKAFAVNEAVSEDYFVFDDQKEIEFSKGDAREIAKEIKLLSESGKEYDVVVNVKGDRKIAISPIVKVAEKLKIKNQSGYTVKNFEGNIYIQDETNLQRISKYPPYEGYVTIAQDLLSEDRDSLASSKEGFESGKSLAKNEETGDYSKTNIQTEGMDEADIVKTDGKYIYYARNKSVSIVDANLSNFKIVSEIKNESYKKNIIDIYLDNKLLTVISEGRKSDSVLVENYVTTVEIYDLSDIKNPKLLKTNEINGSYLESRKKGNIIYFVTSDYIDVEYRYSPDKDTKNDNTKRQKKLKIDSTGIDYSKVIYLPFTPSIMLTNISSITQLGEGATDNLIYMGNQGSIYMSNDNVYMLSLRYSYSRGNEDEKTEIKKFAIENGKFRYVGKNSVEGSVKNQFSMNEENGVFFVAHTKNTFRRDEKRENIITSFDKNMKKISSLGGLAPSEKIYSTRFMQGMAYMVTFKDIVNIDPLFVIDIKDPSKMKALGYLKIPGYSNYLHPFKTGYLIGFGHNTQQNKNGNTVNDGYKISLFDVRDFANPKEVDVLNIGAKGSYSSIGRDHKALMFDNKRDIFAIPVYATKLTRMVSQGRQYDRWVGEFDGAFVIKVSEKGFDTKGKITHYTEKEIVEMKKSYYYDFDYNKKIQRCIQIGDNLYTLSKNMVKVNNINSLEEIKSIELD